MKTGKGDDMQLQKQIFHQQAVRFTIEMFCIGSAFVKMLGSIATTRLTPLGL